MSNTSYSHKPCNRPPYKQDGNRKIGSSKCTSLAKEKDTNTRILFLRYQTTGDTHAKEALFKEWQILAQHWAAHYQCSVAGYEDLYQEGCIALLLAIDRFDLSRHVRFSTFASSYVRGAIKEYFRAKTWQLYVPRFYKDTSVKLKRFYGNMGYTPTCQEVQDLLGVSKDKAEKSLAAMRAWDSVSLSNCSSKIQYVRIGRTIIAEAELDPEMENIPQNLDVANLLHATLSPKEEAVVHMRYYDCLTNIEIAKRMDTYPMAISRLLIEILNKLRREMEAECRAEAS